MSVSRTGRPEGRVDYGFGGDSARPINDRGLQRAASDDAVSLVGLAALRPTEKAKIVA